MFSIIPNGAEYREFVLLKDGQGLLLRIAQPQDVPLVTAFMDAMSRQSLYMRFMAGVSQVPRKFIEDLCTGDPRERACVLAILGEGREEVLAGLGNYVGMGHNAADVAFLVADAFQGRGISTLILERLAGIAAGYGYSGFEADVLSENDRMIHVFKNSGFQPTQAIDGGVIHVEFPVSSPHAVQDRAETRERIATANSLVPLIKPKVVAVVGASREPSALGTLLFRNILRAGFAGAAHPVNPQAKAIEGVRAYPSLEELPEPPDLAIIAVPASKVLSVADRALKAGAKALLVLTAGFAETGAEGRRRQDRLVRLVRGRGARMVGPNCLGLLNTDPAVRLNASLATTMPPLGRIGFYSHSAALGLIILQYAAERGLGFSTFVSAGNRADVSGNDLLQFWEEDALTDIALLYLETFGNPRRFARIARRISIKKPVLCVKSARSGAGRRVALAHIAASPQNDEEVEALFQQAGVIRAETLEEMFDIALLLSTQPLPRGNRVAVVANSGGIATICADACEAHGMVLSGPGVMDLGAMARAEHYERACKQALEHDEVDALIATFACVGACDPSPVARAIRRAAIRAEKATGKAKPVLLSLMGASGAIPVGATAVGESGGPRRVFPSYRFPESAALALARVMPYVAFRSRPPGRLPWYEDAEPARARRVVEAALALRTRADTPEIFTGEKARDLLACFGLALRDKGAGSSPRKAVRLGLSLHADPDFGPLWRLHRQGKPSILRITPMTDADVSEVLLRLGLPLSSGIAATLGRLSQMVEELPWLCALEAKAVLVEAASDEAASIALEPGVKIVFRRTCFRTA